MMIDSEILYNDIQDRIDAIQHQIDTQGRIGALVFHEYAGMIAAWRKVQSYIVDKTYLGE
jgi:hypothetical protein|tara:strand:+ start:960 stop:1139 length:180 start_codon:yes stop_codon:yes gene_type:complete